MGSGRQLLFSITVAFNDNYEQIRNYGALLDRI
jgi:hypothetical protein